MIPPNVPHPHFSFIVRRSKRGHAESRSQSSQFTVRQVHFPLDIDSHDTKIAECQARPQVPQAKCDPKIPWDTRGTLVDRQFLDDLTNATCLNTGQEGELQPGRTALDVAIKIRSGGELGLGE